MIDHPSLKLLQRKNEKAKPTAVMPMLTREVLRKELTEYSQKLAVLKQTLTETSNGYRRLITQVYKQALENVESRSFYEVTELKKFMDKTNKDVTELLTEIVAFLEQMHGNVELERETLEKLNGYLDKV